MSRVRSRIAGLILTGLLTACSSTLPQSASVQQDATPSVVEQPAAATATPTVEPTPAPSEGPVTAAMVQLKISGERYATLGDPSAPITLVEFSDYG